MHIDKYGLTNDKVELWQIAFEDAGSNSVKTDNIVLLKKSIEAFKNAIDDFPHADLPTYWAQSQNNLGMALHQLGLGSGDKSQLLKSIEAFDNALEERTEGAMPLNWALTNNSLGLVLLDLAKFEAANGNMSDAADYLEQSKAKLQYAQAVVSQNYEVSFSDFYLQVFAEIEKLNSKI